VEGKFIDLIPWALSCIYFKKKKNSRLYFQKVITEEAKNQIQVQNILWYLQGEILHSTILHGTFQQQIRSINHYKKKQSC